MVAEWAARMSATVLLSVMVVVVDGEQATRDLTAVALHPFIPTRFKRART